MQPLRMMHKEHGESGAFRHICVQEVAFMQGDLFGGDMCVRILLANG